MDDWSQNRSWKATQLFRMWNELHSSSLKPWSFWFLIPYYCLLAPSELRQLSSAIRAKIALWRHHSVDCSVASPQLILRRQSIIQKFYFSDGINWFGRTVLVHHNFNWRNFYYTCYHCFSFRKRTINIQYYYLLTKLSFFFKSQRTS